MKNRALTTVLVVSLLLTITMPRAAQDDDPDAKSKDEVRKAEKQRVDALLARDVDTLAKAIWADDFSQITDRGELRNKRHRLMAFRDGRVQIKGLTNSIDEVRVYGSTALVTGYTKRTWEEETKEFSGTFRFTRVWVKKDAGWRLVHMQLTKTGE